MDELKSEFEQLSNQQKLEFMQNIMPSICEIFQENPQEMMQKMMPHCQQMMQNCDMDMSQMMGMMEMMKKNQ